MGRSSPQKFKRIAFFLIVGEMVQNHLWNSKIKFCRVKVIRIYWRLGQQKAKQGNRKLPIKRKAATLKLVPVLQGDAVFNKIQINWGHFII